MSEFSTVVNGTVTRISRMEGGEKVKIHISCKVSAGDSGRRFHSGECLASLANVAELRPGMLAKFFIVMKTEPREDGKFPPNEITRVDPWIPFTREPAPNPESVMSVQARSGFPTIEEIGSMDLRQAGPPPVPTYGGWPGVSNPSSDRG